MKIGEIKEDEIPMKNKAMSQSKTLHCHSLLILLLIYYMELLVDVEMILVHIFKLYRVWILMGLLDGMTHCDIRDDTVFLSYLFCFLYFFLSILLKSYYLLYMSEIHV